MKKIIAALFICCFLVACNNKKSNDDSLAIKSDSDSTFYPSDSLLIEEENMDSQLADVDESFDDFIYYFASDSSLQLQRVNFPLPYNDNGVASEITKSTWQHDDLFNEQNYYTLLFDREEDLDLIGDTTLTAVQVEWIYLKSQLSKKYFFVKDAGVWKLDSLQLLPIQNKGNEEFISFFIEFASDSIFQSSRINDPLTFVTADPDDDFSVIETSLDLNQWFAFKPDLPVDKLSNINYGQRQLANSNKKVLALKGMGNGFSNILYFRRKSGVSNWELYKFEDVSI